ncbi:elongation factor Tu GTP binding domain-containing protein, partial [Cardiosporidium cionae]
IKGLRNEKGISVISAFPSEPVEILGFDVEASAGEIIKIAEDYKKAKRRAGMKKRLLLKSIEENSKEEISRRRALINLKERSRAPNRLKLMSKIHHYETEAVPLPSAEAASLISKPIHQTPEISLLIKGKDQGSIEAIRDWIDIFNNSKGELSSCVSSSSSVLTEKKSHRDASESTYIHTEEDRNSSPQQLSASSMLHSMKWQPFYIINESVGALTLTDVQKAIISNAIILGFDVDVLKDAQLRMIEKNIIFKNFTIIYRLFEALEEIFEFYFGPETYFEKVGSFTISRIGKAAISKSKYEKHIVLGISLRGGGNLNLKYKCDVKRGGNILVEKASVLSLHKNKNETTELQENDKEGTVILDSLWEDFQKGDQLMAYKEIPKIPLFEKLSAVGVKK